MSERCRWSPTKASADFWSAGSARSSRQLARSC
jgi:hypothetical protein